jgi:uridine kinase
MSIDARNASSRPLVIGIAGGSGSGKSTVVAQLTQLVGLHNVAFLPHDEYYREYPGLSIEDLRNRNWDDPNALETELLVAHIHALLGGKAIERPAYDFATYARKPETIRVEPRPVMIVEGIMILVEPALRALLDIKMYVDTDADIRFIRRLMRDVEERGRSVNSIVEQYKRTVRPMHLAFVEPSKRYADIIIPWNEDTYNQAAIMALVEMMRARLR